MAAKIFYKKASWSLLALAQGLARAKLSYF